MKTKEVAVCRKDPSEALSGDACQVGSMQLMWW